MNDLSENVLEERIQGAVTLLGTAAELDEVLPKFLGLVANAVGAKGLLLLEFAHDGSHSLRCRAAHGIASASVPNLPIALTRQLRFRNQPAIDLSEVLRGGLLEDVRTATQTSCGSIFALALDTGSRSHGLLLALPEAECAISAEEFAALKQMAQRVSIAIDHERVYAELEESERRYALAARGANGGLWDWDTTQDLIKFSARWCSLLGIERSGMSGTLHTWINRVHPEDREEVEDALEAHLSGENDPLQVEHRLLHENGSYRWMVTRAFAVRAPNGTATRVVGSTTDISAEKAAFRQLLHDAYHDSLSGLPNRALFMERLEELIAQYRAGNGPPLSVMTVRLNRFPTFFDTLGYTAADLLLVRAAARLGDVGPDGTVVARLHGDAFALLVPGNQEFAEDMAGQVHKSFYEPINVQGLDVPISVSIGISHCRDENMTSSTLLQNAHSAVRAARNAGNGVTRVFDTDLHERARMRLQLEVELRQATEENALQVHYQPIFDLKTEEIIGCEALARWNHPVHGPISPDLFIPLAEDMGLIETLGTWVLRKACSAARDWQDVLPAPLAVSVNLAPEQFLSGRLVSIVNKVLEETGLDPKLLKLEITERTIFEEQQTGRDSLNELRDLGVQLVIDDFGSGYSSLEYLIRFQVDEIKLDRTFIEGLVGAPQNQKVVHAMVSMAHNLGLRVTAEGVEKEEQKLLLQGLQCNYGQGFLLTPALPSGQFLALVQGLPPENTETQSHSERHLTLAKN